MLTRGIQHLLHAVRSDVLVSYRTMMGLGLIYLVALRWSRCTPSLRTVSTNNYISIIIDDPAHCLLDEKCHPALKVNSGHWSLAWMGTLFWMSLLVFNLHIISHS
jgi:hypothetical protein